MRQVRICIYGGTDLKGAPTKFISELAYEILKAIPGAIIVTGGFLHSNDKPEAKSTDVAALEGARRYAQKYRTNLKECFEAWIPEPILDKRPEIKEAVRMTESDGITVRVMKGRTPLGRRLAMVAGVDFVATISGKVHTEVVIEQALELGLPVLPIPDAGGDSRRLLKEHTARISASFEPGALEKCLKEVSKWIRKDDKLAARAVVSLIKGAKLGKCLVLCPYDDKHNVLYKSVVEPAVAKHMIPLRLDELPRSDAIYSSFADSMRSSAAVIADITVLNENVMYEIGYAHGLGLKPLLYTRSKQRLNDLPVYFRTLYVRLESKTTPLKTLIDQYLSSFKEARGIRQPTE